MIVKPEQVLFPGERLLWTGRPQRARHAMHEIALTLYLVIAAPVIVAVILVSNFKRSEPRWFITSAVTAAVGSLGQAVAYVTQLLVIAPRTRASATYAITDRRVVVITGLRTRTADSAYISTLPPPQITQHNDGTSTLRFDSASRRPRPQGGLRRAPFGREAPTPTLPNLSNADATNAFAALQQARHAPRGIDAATTWLETSPSSAATPPIGWTSAPGESVLWVGRPDRARWWYSANDAYMSCFGLAWTAIVIVIASPVISSGNWPSAAGLLLFAAFGIHLIIGRVLWRRARIRRSTYILTSHRVATVWNLRRPRVVSAPLTHVRPPALSDDGTLTFTAIAPPTPRRSGDSMNALLSPAATSEPPVFLALTDAMAVYRLVGAAQATAAASTSNAAA